MKSILLPSAWQLHFILQKRKAVLPPKKKIDLLCRHIKIAATNQDCVTQCLANKKIHDFEDGLEYYAAKEAGCECIITEDTNDFYFSEISVLKAEMFIKKHFGYLKY